MQAARSLQVCLRNPMSECRAASRNLRDFSVPVSWSQDHAASTVLARLHKLVVCPFSEADSSLPICTCISIVGREGGCQAVLVCSTVLLCLDSTVVIPLLQMLCDVCATRCTAHTSTCNTFPRSLLKCIKFIPCIMAVQMGSSHSSALQLLILAIGRMMSCTFPSACCC